MKTIQTLLMPAAVLAMALSLPAQAGAAPYKFAPASTTFRASGPAFVFKDGEFINCTMTTRMKTTKTGGLKFVQVQFTGDAGCPDPRLLPWKAKGASANTGLIGDLQISTPYGICDARPFPMLLQDGTAYLTYTFSDCGAALSATLPTTPPLTLVPR